MATPEQWQRHKVLGLNSNYEVSIRGRDRCARYNDDKLYWSWQISLLANNLTLIDDVENLQR